jgi:SAM-dependent methyltransferase
VSGFAADWLALREPADTAARDATLTARLAELTRRRTPARFIDLGCGTGANLRYLAPRLGGLQEWVLVDSDMRLLEQVRGAPHVQHETRCLDLATGLDALELAAGAVVTASALLDLVSDRWLAKLIDRCRASGAVALFALSYDGRMALAPADDDDEWIRRLVNHHQLGDKGFGPALGPGAAMQACERFADAGYEVQTAPSDWTLGPEDGLLQQQLLEGWAHAAAEVAPGEANRCRKWLERRLAHVASGASRTTVGHQDILAWPR